MTSRPDSLKGVNEIRIRPDYCYNTEKYYNENKSRLYSGSELKKKYQKNLYSCKNTEIYALSIDHVCLYLYAKSFKDTDSQTLKDFKDPGEPCVFMN